MMKLDGIAADFEDFEKALARDRESGGVFGKLSLSEPRFALGIKPPYNMAKIIFLDDVKHGEPPRNPRRVEIEFYDKAGYLDTNGRKDGRRISKKYQFTVPTTQADDPMIKEYLRALQEWQPDCAPKVMMVMYFSVLVLDTTKQPGEKYYAQKRLFRYTKRWYEPYNAHVLMATQDTGTLRGIQFLVQRGADTMSPCLGGPIPQTFTNSQGAQVVKMSRHYSEEALKKSFGHEARKKQNGDIYAQADEDIRPFDYEKVAAPMSIEELRGALGLKSKPQAQVNSTSFNSDDVLEEIDFNGFVTPGAEVIDTAAQDKDFVASLLSDEE